MRQHTQQVLHKESHQCFSLCPVLHICIWEMSTGLEGRFLVYLQPHTGEGTEAEMRAPGHSQTVLALSSQSHFQGSLTLHISSYAL